MNKSYAKMVGALAATISMASATAAVMPSCTLDSYAITAAAGAGATPVSLGATINATSCLGVKTMEPGKNPASVKPDDGNLGYLNDGLLNGEGGLVPWNTFISATQLQDLNPATKGAVDPGWIQLGTMSSSNGTLSTSSIGTGASAFNLGNVLTFTEKTTNTTNGGGLKGGIAGTWTLNLNPNIVNILHANGLFLRNNFDQLAFVVKASNSWAVYDFDFTKIGGFDLTKPYSLSGTWNLNDFRNPTNKADQGLSFLGVWARDPMGPASNNVPEPGILGLFGAGLVSLMGLRRRKAR